MNKIFLSLISFFIGIILVELSLQGYGLYLDHKRNEAEPALEGKIRILALGESTTDIVSAPESKPWPFFLEKFLNEKHPGLKFAVINKARVGASTNYLLQNLPDQLIKYKPHLVIVMMGLNDSSNLGFLHEASWFSKIKLVRLFRSWRSSSERPDEATSKNIWNIVKKIKSPGEIPPELDDFIRKNPDKEWLVKRFLSQHYLNLSRKMEGDELHETEKAAFNLLKDVLRMKPTDVASIFHLAHSVRGRPYLHQEAREVVKEALRKGYHPMPEQIRIFHLINYQADPEMVGLLEKMGIRRIPERPVDLTKKNFLRLEELVKKSGARLAVMAYPTIDPELFRHFFSDHKLEKWTTAENMKISQPPAHLPEKYRHIIFLENKNFPFVFDREMYLDMMIKAPELKVGFGHTTKKGHELIGKNAGLGLSGWISELQTVK